MRNSEPLLSRLAPYWILLAALISLAIPPGQRPQPAAPRATALPTPPGPPVLETFQGEPQLALFPRLGSFRPADGEDALPFWRTYRMHLLKGSGVVKANPISGNLVFSFRGISGIDSLGHFAPLAVAPDTPYRVRLKLNFRGEEDASVGIGILEYRRFIWHGEQYTESLHQQLHSGSQELLRIEQTDGWQEFVLPFRSGPETKMIHLVFFREGPVNEKNPVLLDNIAVEPL